MFRISQFMQEIAQPVPLGAKRNPPGPVVVWNLIRRCNLTCKHCYSISADKDFAGELSTEEIFSTMDDLKRFRVPVLILSGGEPLLHPDIFEISRRAKEMGFYVGLSSNGTLIDESNIGRIAAVGYDYVGVSLDGIKETHDEFRRMAGAFDKSMHGIRLCKARGIKVGIRFTLTQGNAHDLPGLLRLMEDEGLDKFYLSHLNYAGRGNKNRKHDVYHQATRQAMDMLLDTCWRYRQEGKPNGHGKDVSLKNETSHARFPHPNPLPQAGEGANESLREFNVKEFVSGNNDADGVYLLLWVRKNFPHLEDHIRAKLEQWGGNSSGVNVANIDNLGNVHPDTMWWDYNLGNVRERPFSAIWTDTSDPIMAGLKAHPRKVGGRCGKCRYFNICGGNTRVRAWQVSGDLWAEDPACYLDDDEIGIADTIMTEG